MSTINSLVGFGSLIAGSVCLGLAYTNDPNHIEHKLFLGGIILYGIFGYCVSTPLQIMLINLVRKCLAYCDYRRLNEEIEILVNIPDQNARVNEDIIVIIGPDLLESRESLKELDPEQVLALADLPNFKRKLEAGAFNERASELAYMYLNLQEMPIEELSASAKAKQITDYVKIYPFFGDKINELLPPKSHIDVNTPLLAQYKEKKYILDEKRDPHKTVYRSAMIAGELVTLSMTEWSAISQNIKNSFDDLAESSEIMTKIMGTREDQEILLIFIKMPIAEREKIKLSKSNREYYRHLDLLYDIKFLHAKFDEFYMINGVPEETLKAKLNFVILANYPRTKKLLIDKLRDRFAAFKPDSEEFLDDECFACLAMIPEDEDRKLFLEGFPWEDFRKVLARPDFLRKYWEKAVVLGIQPMKKEIIDFCSEAKNLPIRAQAWKVLPDDIYDATLRNYSNIQ